MKKTKIFLVDFNRTKVPILVISMSVIIALVFAACGKSSKDPREAYYGTWVGEKDNKATGGTFILNEKSFIIEVNDEVAHFNITEWTPYTNPKNSGVNAGYKSGYNIKATVGYKGDRIDDMQGKLNIYAYIHDNGKSIIFGYGSDEPDDDNAVFTKK